MSPVTRPPSALDKFMPPVFITILLVALPMLGYQDIIPRVCFVVLGALWLKLINAHRAAVRFYRMRQLPWDLTPRCGVPLMVGGFCDEPASPGCCYCDIHANWPESDRNLNSPSLPRGL